MRIVKFNKGEPMTITKQIKFVVSDVCQAFADKAVGSKVLSSQKDFFLKKLVEYVEAHDTSKDRVPGQHFIVIQALKNTAIAGDGPRSDNPDDYVVRTWRGQPSMFLKREKAGEVNFLAVVVYTMDAYLKDPDVKDDEHKVQQLLMQSMEGITHVIVAVIAACAPAATLGYRAFVHNLAGGNNEWPAPSKVSTDPNAEVTGYTLYGRVVKTAKEIEAYWEKWAVVAD